MKKILTFLFTMLFLFSGNIIFAKQEKIKKTSKNISKNYQTTYTELSQIFSQHTITPKTHNAYSLKDKNKKKFYFNLSLGIDKMNNWDFDPQNGDGTVQVDYDDSDPTFFSSIALGILNLAQTNLRSEIELVRHNVRLSGTTKKGQYDSLPFSAELTQIGLMTNLYLQSEANQLSPFIMAGIGAHFGEIEKFKNKNHNFTTDINWTSFAYQYGFGISWFILDSLAYELSYRHFNTIGNSFKYQLAGNNKEYEAKLNFKGINSIFMSCRFLF